MAYLSALARSAFHLALRVATWRLSCSQGREQHGSRFCSRLITWACHHSARNVLWHTGHLHGSVFSATAYLAVRHLPGSDQSDKAQDVLMPTTGAFDRTLEAAKDGLAGHLPLERPFRAPSESAPEREPIAGGITLEATLPN